MRKSKTKNRRVNTKKTSSNWLDSLGTILSFPHFLLIFILLLSLFLVFIFTGNNKSNQLYESARNQFVKVNKPQLKYNVFGDHFVNDLSIDTSRTNFKLDLLTTAYTFNPQYEWTGDSQCQDKYCGGKAIDYHFASSNDEVEYCLNRNCLRVSDNELYYNDRKLVLPQSINANAIRNITIYPLSRTWLVGFVYEDDNVEKGRVYSFNGSRFNDLDADNKNLFVSKNDYKGAVFGFGGDDSNYIVLYGGYYFQGYQQVGDKRFDISNFIGLRVSNRGFSPIAFKEEVTGDTIWFVCSLDENKPRLIKLWQNGSDSIKGSIAFTDDLLEDRENASSAICKKGNNPGEINLVIKTNNRYYHKIFKDKGFEQNKYVLSSKSLLPQKGSIDKAKFEGFIACDNVSCDDEVFERSLLFKVSGDGIFYYETTIGETIDFSDMINLNGLYWQIEAEGKKGEVHYSPWVDGLTDVSYSWWKDLNY